MRKTITISPRNYWKEYDLLSFYDDGMNIDIAIVGLGETRDKLLYYGLLYNIYRADHKIRYHIWGDKIDTERMCVDFDMMTGDQVIYHGQSIAAGDDVCNGMDRVILMEDMDSEKVKRFVDALRTDQVHILSPCECGENNWEDRLAMELNYQYECLYGAEIFNAPDREERIKICWESLEKFTRESNVAAADYHIIRKKVLEHMDISEGDIYESSLEDQLCRLEHIKWCRFHFLNGWKPGIPEDGRAKDSKARIHRSLIPYDELTADEKKKDLEVIKLMFKLSPME